MDCDDVTLLLAAREAATLPEPVAEQFHRHVADCAACRELAGADGERFRWVVRVPEDALDDPDLLVLPTIDPVVFTGGRELARGGMGRITRARDRRLGRDVAIKEVLVPGMRARFEREVAITAQLQHPAIVPVYEAGTWPNGAAFYTMRLVSGGTLADAIARTASLEQRLALVPHVIALTEALAYAHSRGIVHRDLKPGNVLVGEFGETVVIDWGLAKEVRTGADPAGEPTAPAAPELTGDGQVIGTPGFMAPEQAAGDGVDERADVYALGAILYSALVGHPPYWDQADHTPDALVALARQRPPTPLAELAPRIPADLRAIVERAMARAGADRYPSAKEMADELRRFEAGQLLRSRDYRLRDLVARWVRRHRAAVIVGAIAFLVVAGIAASAIINVARSRTAERTARHTAELARASAEANVVRLLEEQGRDQLVSGDRDRAFAFLAEAYRRGDDTTAGRHLLAAAARDLDLLGATIDGGRGGILAAGFAGDGRAVTIDGGDTAAIAVWDGDRQVFAHPLPGDVTGGWLDPGARRAAIVTRDGRVAIRDVPTGAALWEIRDPALVAATLVFAPDGKHVAVIAGRPGGHAGAQLRAVETGTLVATLVAGSGDASAAAFSPDGRRVAATDTSGAIGVWDIASSKPILRATSLPASSLAFAGNDRLVVTSGYRDPRIWHIAGGEPQRLVGDHGAIDALAVSPRGELIATGDSSGTVRLWRSDGEPLGEAHDARGEVTQLAFSPDGSQLAGGGGDRRVYVWDTVALELLRAVGSDRERGEPLHRLSWLRDGSRLVTVRSGEPRALVWRAPTGHRVARVDARGAAIAGPDAVIANMAEVATRRLATGTEVARIPVEPVHDGRWLVAPDRVYAGRDGTRALVWYRGGNRGWIYDLTTGATLSSPSLPGPNLRRPELGVSLDGRRVVQLPTGAGEPTTVRVLDTASGRVVRELPVPAIPDAALSPDGDRCAFAFGTRDPILVRVATGERIALAPLDRAALHARFDPSGHRLILYGRGLARVVDADTGRTIADLPGIADAIEDARFTGDGHRVATWSDNRSAKLWDTDAGAVLVAVDGVPYGGVAVSPDGLRLATGADDGTIRIWDSATARLLELLHGDGPHISELAWSLDGTRLLASSNSTLHASIWDVHTETRSPAQIDELARRSAAYKLVDGLLVPAR